MDKNKICCINLGNPRRNLGISMRALIVIHTKRFAEESFSASTLGVSILLVPVVAVKHRNLGVEIGRIRTSTGDKPLSIAFHDISGQKVKNIAEPVRAFRLVPGKVAVEPDKKSKGSVLPRGGRTGLITSGFVLAVVLGATAYFIAFRDTGSQSASPFDGHWRVTVDSLSGCLNNNRRSFPILVLNGKIDMKNLRFPKTGSVAQNGTFKIISINRDGIEMNTQTGSLSGNSGTGTFVGRKPGCRGVVTLQRVD